jgi:hypothetical protein
MMLESGARGNEILAKLERVEFHAEKSYAAAARHGLAGGERAERVTVTGA